MNTENIIETQIKKGSDEDPFLICIKYWFENKHNILKFRYKHKEEYNRLITLTEFLPEKCDVRNRMWHIFNGANIPLCKTCNTKHVKWYTENRCYREYCSAACVSNSLEVRSTTKNTNMDRYGGVSPANNSLVRDKMQKTMEQKYGASNPLQVDDIKKKYKDSIRKKYGVENISQLDTVKQKKKYTTKCNYGVEYTLQLQQFKDILQEAAWTDESRTKRKQTNRKLYGKDNPNQKHITDENLQKLDDIDWLYDMHYNKKYNCEYIATLLDVDRHTVGLRLKNAGYEILNLSNRSSKEVEIFEFVSQYFFTRSNARDIIDGELDIFIPDLNIAFEYCGLYWHSEHRVGKDYHHTKYLKCKQKGIRLIQIFEDEYLNNKQLVLDKIKNILGKTSNKIYARKCNLQEIDYETSKRFLDTNHIQGAGVSSINLALFYQNSVVAVGSFLKRTDGEYEMTRYCSKNVIGGFSKIIKNLPFNYSKIFTFADLRWSDGGLYEKNNFKKVSFVKPDYSYCKSEKRYHKFGFRKKILKTKLKNYDENLTEYENCKNNGYYRIYDAGKIKYEYNSK